MIIQRGSKAAPQTSVRLLQYFWVNLIISHGFTYVQFAWVISNLILFHQGYVFLASEFPLVSVAWDCQPRAFSNSAFSMACVTRVPVPLSSSTDLSICTVMQLLMKKHAQCSVLVFRSTEIHPSSAHLWVKSYSVTSLKGMKLWILQFCSISLRITSRIIF